MGLGGRAVVALSGPSLIILAAGRARRYGGVKQLAPIGKHGEGVIDLLASDAWASGFEDIVIIVNSETGKQIEEHVAARWPKEHKVSFAVQSRLRGTVDAVLAAENNLDLSKPFGVSNADDLYGRAAFLLLGERLAASPHNCLVGFELDRALVGDLPVSRGTCMVEDGRLTEIVERRNVHSTLEGYDADDCLEPVSLSPLATVSMNLWGFHPAHAQVNLPAQLRNRLRAAVVDLRWAGPREHVTRFRSPADAFALHRDHPREGPAGRAASRTPGDRIGSSPRIRLRLNRPPRQA